MALPRLNDTPKHSVDIPSTGKTVRFRPFLVKEEKVLLLAMESKNEDDILASIVDTIEACVQDEINVNKLTTFDIEYMFTKIRAKSVGETATVNVPCSHCETENEITIPVDNIEVKRPKEVSNIIDLQPGIQVEMNYPYYKDISTDKSARAETADGMFALIRKCFSAVLTEDERIDMSEESPAEIDAFIESMNSEQFEKVKEFLDNIPAMEHDVTFECTNCQTHNTQTLKGMQAFF